MNFNTLVRDMSCYSVALFLAPGELKLFKLPLNFSYYFPIKTILFTGNKAALVFFWLIFAMSVFSCSFPLNFFYMLMF